MMRPVLVLIRLLLHLRVLTEFPRISDRDCVVFLMTRFVPRFDNVFSSCRKGTINKDVSLLSFSFFFSSFI